VGISIDASINVHTGLQAIFAILKNVDPDPPLYILGDEE
tara:strand:- start:89 stop:205 length:117 start_codon:yes stop_codon:yes gene_type:complete